MADPLIRLRGLTRSYEAGEQRITVLDRVDLDIRAGEMVAIVGTSGSGKSTLMNLIGCLDRPSAGSYLYAGQDVSAMDEAARARLRRAHFGFIFQRYQLLADLDATGNVEIPAIYAGAAPGARRARATALLARLGLGERAHHRPGALSGGQQQRVSVARALMNGGEVILADEPTGALDSRSGAELMALLHELNAQGHTIIIVTHDPEVAAQATRVVEIRDGRILSDSGTPAGGAAGDPGALVKDQAGTRRQAPLAGAETGANAATAAESEAGTFAAGADAPGERDGALVRAGRLREALAMALRALNAHRLRSFLTMLGIIIGIASVVSVVALGQGSQQRVLENIASIGTNTITIRAGTGFGDRRASAIRTLTTADAEALAREDFAASVSPEITASQTASRGRVSTSVSLRGVGPGYFDVGAYKTASGTLFGTAAIDRREQVAVLDASALGTFFPDGSDPVGQTVKIGKVPLRVIGTVTAAGASFGPDTPKIFTPWTTAALRVAGSTTLSSITVRVADDTDMSEAEARIQGLILARHGTQDFFLQNSDTIRETITSTAATLTWLVSAIAVISLFVGGIGVMNIMLVSVTERTKEIGVRVAVGARRSDIVAQFLTEAVMVCLLGGLIGIALAFGIGQGVELLRSDIRMSYSAGAALAAFLSSTLIGITFGYLPARRAARLDPVVALTRE
ncbi:MacB family efflux pump subunit [Frigidibacter sp. MR17.14]|uniref:MacB family efflux pump subunit n=1 Tax=Frigidibacter sp. MR17.14 TaxID=3126509 RepID=UPI003012EFBA